MLQLSLSGSFTVNSVWPDLNFGQLLCVLAPDDAADRELATELHQRSVDGRRELYRRERVLESGPA
jgi:hypothetical protein